ncbi:MAG: hypothetical protein OH319_04030 [Candidatus Parvarchaeota archaeon]|nr:hypothetical protein [Candidatus Jingweiarchaeum tengchongense]MCW1298045.1 hypothetical protein [Candidatus Jingweiarchaeum tengchongense]MCW1300155.1 hypothetical protein [Candidatus Jingweiarchaeum tengchongense]MCW1304365.1 hypothetical protein [Candidatus Jingweiarchaeum tengchongense]MCW1305915.1 hypothetical protein [Candidatus Jingweiarchaeum tengchongense]
MPKSVYWKKIYESYFSDVIEEAKYYANLCFSGKRWYGNALLIIIDACLDSIGLNYFKIVVPRVEKFYEDYVRTRKISTLEDFVKLNAKDERLRKLIKNERVWNACLEICKRILRIKKEQNLSDFGALKYWAKKANYENWEEDEIGKIKGVGLITFQYLRMQVGVDTSMPDKIIKRSIERLFKIKSDNEIDLIKKIEVIANKIGISQIELCWAIWIKESDKGNK